LFLEGIDGVHGLRCLLLCPGSGHSIASAWSRIPLRI
jgi:hypothetical protein